MTASIALLVSDVSATAPSPSATASRYQVPAGVPAGIVSAAVPALNAPGATLAGAVQQLAEREA